MTPQDVDVLERRLTENPGDSDARKLLISYYFQHAQREPRLRHICWMIENDPGSDIFDFRGAVIPAYESPLGGPEDFQRVFGLNRCGSTLRVPGYTQTPPGCFRQDDPERAAEFWRRALSLEPDERQWTFLLARLHAFVLQTDGRIHPTTAWSAERKAFADRFVALRTSNDALLVGQVDSRHLLVCRRNFGRSGASTGLATALIRHDGVGRRVAPACSGVAAQRTAMGTQPGAARSSSA